MIVDEHGAPRVVDDVIEHVRAVGVAAELRGVPADEIGDTEVLGTPASVLRAAGAPPDDRHVASAQGLQELALCPAATTCR